MKTVKLKSLLAVAFSGVLVLASAPGLASATLAGENGPIVYVEEGEVEVCETDEAPAVDSIQAEAVNEDWCYDEDVTQVVTTNAQGQNPVVAAEIVDDGKTGEEITTATISPNDTAGNHSIVFASEDANITCEDYAEEIEADLLRVENEVYDDGYCYYANEAVIYKVMIDKNGNPLSDPVVVTRIGAPENTETNANYYIELSYAPDQKTVVGLRFYYSEPIHEYNDKSSSESIDWNQYGPKHVIERITLADGLVEQLVGPKFDPFMNVGYAQSGAIYFTQLICDEYCEDESIVAEDDWSSWRSELWYFAPGSSEAKQVTDTPEIQEYFLSVSPDSKTVLVCDPTTALYYTVSTATGEVTTLSIEDVNNPFLPLFFSPDGKSYLGTIGLINQKHCQGRYLAARTLANELVIINEDDEEECGTAIAALEKFKDAVIVNQLEGPDDWAPIVKTTTTTTSTPQVLGTTTKTTPKLQSTGSTAVSIVAVGFAIMTIAGLSGIYRKQEN